MKLQELREKFINFFEAKGHKHLPSSSLVPQDDPSVLLTTAGMQQFKKYFAGAEKSEFPMVVTIQKCVRTSDIEEVGDNTHLTFFEMLGNFSFDNYFKEDAIKWSLEFIEKELGVDRSRIWVSIFKGDKEVPRDDISEKIWLSLGMPKDKIKEFGREDNFWGPTGTEGPCGPTSEIYVDDVEVWNLVFNEFYMQPDGVLLPLEQKGVDTGAGIERLAATLNQLPSVYNTDEFEKVIDSFWALMKPSDQTKNTRDYTKHERVIADHIRSATFLLADGVRPSNLGRGYILRRLIRRAVAKYFELPEPRDQKICSEIARTVIAVYSRVYPNLLTEEKEIISEFDIEEARFLQTLEAGMRKFDRIAQIKYPNGKMDESDGHNLRKLENLQAVLTGADAFELFATYGFPYEMTLELAKGKGIKITESIQAEFESEFEKHQEASRKGAEKKFKGGLETGGEQETKFHTATHLMYRALQIVLGDHVKQAGANITAERIRFDFTHPEKMTPEEIEEVEKLVNAQIKAALPVKLEEMPLDEAKKQGASGIFDSKYGDVVKVYTIGDFSKEICGGPHVKNTSELGVFKIKKEESSSQGVRRIKAILE